MSSIKRCISEFSGRLGVYPGRLFVFGETKRPAVADLFVVPHLAMRLIFRLKITLHAVRGFWRNQDVQGAAEPYLFVAIIIDARGGSVKRKNNKFRRQIGSEPRDRSTTHAS